MKKRITCMLLVLCMVLAAVPTALAGQAVEDQIDFSLLKKHQANETQTLQVESVQKLLVMRHMYHIPPAWNSTGW